jgi:hypothetical protein
MKQQPLKFTEETELHVGDYFRAYKSKYFTHIKEIAENQRNFEFGYGEYKTTLIKVDIYDKEENLLASNSIVPIDNLISGALAKYIPNIKYDPSYLGNTDPYNYPVHHKIWRDMLERCFDCKSPEFPYIGAIGTTVCDRWKCFEYFVADFIHIDGYKEAGDKIFYQHYIVDLYDIQKNIHPSKRIYAPGYVKLKPFKQSDICKYTNLPPKLNNYPKDLETAMKYRTGEIDIKETLFTNQTGMNIVLDLTPSYYYDNNVGYQPLVARILYPYNYNSLSIINKPMKNMCTIIRKD